MDCLLVTTPDIDSINSVQRLRRRPSLWERNRLSMVPPLLQGVKLVKCSSPSETVDAEEALANVPALALYFSAHWCPPCQRFTPILSDLYGEVNEDSKQLEVVFVSSDDDEAQWTGYMKHHGDWLSVPYAGELRAKLKRQYGVCAGKEQQAVGVADRLSGIPGLVVIKQDGSLITLDGASDVERKGPAAVQAWARASQS